ncbi:3-phosphoserine/phosphohydroxythreonine transaminase [Mesobacillus subterraneus]|uniref:3-phosphoserine/phosphohydroxythreonine transaminase n=1 Tax=Mesobacillus subterraneus TaxID=285983 RepID=UPI00203C8515|nr:3-phosphoserine/phosphohydroxythreonine transaminase [Mesobacillus subterraneus]MCM3662908.1 3-phosphoserine/phosphohydroxythreonine transaminase [Mesobacillus subterraneus]MCM3682916.1 3-phosphoserine/phosphohydroxythreonine transaminase [Mesobacillus subterraneus]
MKRAYNFNAGPASLPVAVLEKAKKEMMNYQGSGMAVMELSHRSKEFEEINERTKKLLSKLLSIPDDYEILFLQGGASLQFSMVPMNLLENSTTASYVLTGTWSEKALKEAKKIGNAIEAASTKHNNYKSIPSLTEIDVKEDVAYLHITTNNTIFGTQWHSLPEGMPVPLVADMSSDILSRPLNISSYGLIYAGAQKNLGPSGVTVVIIQKDLLKRSRKDLPSMLNYQVHASSQSLYNTPPTLSVYFLMLVLEWAEALGGVEELERMNKEKAALLYDTIDQSGGFYTGHAEKDSRSLMNVTFTLGSDELTASFLQEAEELGFIGLAGHRSVGGCRASIYNAVPLEHVEKLVKFMSDFRLRN